MNVGSDTMPVAEMEEEYGVPYGEDAATADMAYINSEKFAKKFERITKNKLVNRTLLECSRKAIAHRNGTLYEDMYLINGISGEIMAEQLNSDYEKGITYNDGIKAAIVKAKVEQIPLIAFHSHPEGYPPSIEDFNKAYDNNYSLGVVVGHNGQVYVYENSDNVVDNPNDVQALIVSSYSRGYDVDRAYKEAYAEVGLAYRIVKG